MQNSMFAESLIPGRESSGDFFYHSVVKWVTLGVSGRFFRVSATVWWVFGSIRFGRASARGWTTKRRSDQRGWGSSRSSQSEMVLPA